MSVIAMPAATSTATPEAIAALHTPLHAPQSPVTTGQLPILSAGVFGHDTSRHRPGRTGAVTVAQLGGDLTNRGTSAHSAARLGNRGWRFAR